MMKTGGKLGKLKCMIKRWHSSKTLPHSSASTSPSSITAGDDDNWHAASFHADEVPAGYHPVYVGKSRRRYLVGSDLAGHPLFRNLVQRSGGDGTVIDCEVVLFEHLLWMLENADPQPESLDELVDFYAC